MFKPFTLVAVGLSLALSGAALAKEKIDFMFPAPVDGKLTMEMTRVIKQFNDSQQDVEVRGIFTGNYDTTQDQSRIGAEGRPATGAGDHVRQLHHRSGAERVRSCRWMSCFKYGDQKAGNFLQTEFWPAMPVRTPR
ncbi:hypothetical protein MJK71_03575 [Escherichia coli]|nr:hypothetical protein MJK71_03575 [Escherichia coli]